MAITVDDLLVFVSQDGKPNEAQRKQAGLALSSALGVVEAYTRGRHVTVAGDSKPGIDSVVLTVAARMLANPSQLNITQAAGVFSQTIGRGYQGLTLGEQQTLNRYRQRAR